VTDSQLPEFVNPRVLKINVGFILAEGAGYQRTIELDLPRVLIGGDLELDFVRGALRLSRNSRGIFVRGELESAIVGECARCLAVAHIPVSFEIEELFAYPPIPEEPYSVQETGMLDLAPLLREEAILAVPMTTLCRPDCAGLCPVCGKNLNDGPCDCEQDEIDPRLAGLRALLEDDPAQDSGDEEG